ncbi:hypothetical protein AB0D22_07580 [Kitasatospora sp. NPDC048538]|uniref:hypothetical protein n=1 Tax=Kitasatospora sp. NPDC048538 TaxID=3155633 RepID=UPI0034074E7A
MPAAQPPFLKVRYGPAGRDESGTLLPRYRSGQRVGDLGVQVGEARVRGEGL